MTKRELVEAFLRGDVDRRQFVSRLTMLGVSGGAAVAYAASLAPSAAARPAQPASGFVMRAQATDDEEYGTAVTFPSDEEAIAAAADAVEEVLAVLGALDGFTADDFEDGVYETLTTIRDQQEDHLEALNALTGATQAFSQQDGAGQQFASPDEFLSALAESLETQSSTYAAVVPAVQNGEARQTAMNVASVANRHAALAHDFADMDPIPESFQEPLLLG